MVRERGQETVVHSSQQEVVMEEVKCNNMDHGSGFYGLWLQFLGGKGGTRGGREAVDRIKK